VISKEEQLQLCRDEAIELLNQGYLAKAIVHLEKGLIDNSRLQANVAFRQVKQLAIEGKFQSKNHFINLIKLIK